MKYSKIKVKELLSGDLGNVSTDENYKNLLFNKNVSNNLLLEDICFENCMFDNIDFGNIKLVNVSFVNCYLKNCDLSNQVFDKQFFSKVDFENCKLRFGLEYFPMPFSFKEKMYFYSKNFFTFPAITVLTYRIKEFVNGQKKEIYIPQNDFYYTDEEVLEKLMLIKEPFSKNRIKNIKEINDFAKENDINIIFYFVPVEPKPPAPLVVSSKSDTSVSSGSSTGFIIICATLSNG